MAKNVSTIKIIIRINVKSSSIFLSYISSIKDDFCSRVKVDVIIVLNYYLWSDHEHDNHLPNSGTFHKSEVVEHYVNK